MFFAMLVATLWVSNAFRDFFVAYAFPRDPRGNFVQLTLASTSGRIAFWKDDCPAKSYPEAFGWTHGIDQPTTYDWPWLFGSARSAGYGLVTQRSFGLFGLYWQRALYTGAMTEQTVAIPDPLLLIAFLALSARCLLHHRRRQSGRCRVCGYDLRATPNRCPECGTVPNAVKDTSLS